jgi:hypothetical protein
VDADFTILPGGLFRGVGGGGGGGGTTTPGGSNTQIQYNNNGAFGGVPNLTWNGTTLSATGSFTGSFTGSLLGTASYASNGGVTQLLAGSNITLSPTNGRGQVTISSTGGGGVYGNTATGSYGSFYDTTTQTITVINTLRSMSLNTTDISNGVSISGSVDPYNTYIKTENAGIYDIQFSAQIEKTSAGGTSTAYIWLRKNGIDLAQTNTAFELSQNAKGVAAWNWFVNSNANDYYQIMWTADATDIQLAASTPTYGPAVPSIIATVNRVDQFLSNTGSFTGSFTGDFTGSLIGTSSWATNALTASFAPNYVLTSQTSSMTVLSSSFALTASYVPPSPSAGLVYYMTTNPASLTVSGGVEQNLASITIPANTVQVGDRLEIFYSFSKVGTNAVSSYRIKISGSGTDGTLLNNGANQGATVLGLTSQNLYRVLSTSSMVGSSQFFGGAATVGTTVNYTGSSLTGSNTFYFNAVRNSAADTITLNDCYIKILR